MLAAERRERSARRHDGGARDGRRAPRRRRGGRRGGGRRPRRAARGARSPGRSRGWDPRPRHTVLQQRPQGSRGCSWTLIHTSSAARPAGQHVAWPPEIRYFGNSVALAAILPCMSFLLPCPNCGPREVEEFRCSGEVTRRPKSHADAPGADDLHLLPRQRGGRAHGVVVPPARLRGLVPRRARYPYERGRAHLAPGGPGAETERRRRGLRHLMSRLPARPDERIDRGESLAFEFDGQRLEGYAGDTIASALYAAGRRDLLPQLQVPPAPRAALLLRALRELPDDGGRRSQHPRLHRAAP